MTTAAPRTSAGPPRRAAARFVLTLAGLMLVFNLLVMVGIPEDGAFSEYLKLNARAAAAIISWWDPNVSNEGFDIQSGPFSIRIKAGCDGVQAIAFFVFAVFLSPVSVSRWSRTASIAAGSVILAALNLTRILSLFLVREHWPAAFEFFHVEVWQTVFVIAPLGCWLFWLQRALPAPANSQ